ncbi:hypothetical protein [Mucilaginibacter sp.]|jgi:hypothetical protein|uniref:hypothetical protein n=1 Tax=Mucilaginibacter sp. TaxID=1882438 RepID=UPI0035658E49
MKKYIIAAIIVLATAFYSKAQNTKTANQGFWVIESNVHAPKTQIVRFYNDSSKLLYEEVINTRLNIKRKKNQQLLNQICNKLHEQKEIIEGNKLIAVAFNLKH